VTGSHPSGRLDDLIHQRTRLGIMTVLSEVANSDFTFLRDTLELSDGNLSRHLTVLEEAGYVEISKGYRGRRPHTSVTATKTGQKALAEYLTNLQAVINRVRSPAEAVRAKTTRS
jgi:DNA-binding MarR family transcriptional regulator